MQSKIYRIFSNLNRAQRLLTFSCSAVFVSNFKCLIKLKLLTNGCFNRSQMRNNVKKQMLETINYLQNAPNLLIMSLNFHTMSPKKSLIQ